jgi:thiol-disulfide isomerase/thioredoxin
MQSYMPSAWMSTPLFYLYLMIEMISWNGGFWMKMRYYGLLALLILVPALGGSATDTSQQTILPAGMAAPGWTLKDSAGNLRHLSDYRGKIVVLDFWATWCGPCKLSMPEIQKIHVKYGGQGVVVLGMNAFETSDPAKFMAANGYTYSLIMKADEVAGLYKVTGIPAVFVIDASGKIYYSRLGYYNDTALSDAIAALVKKGT